VDDAIPVKVMSVTVEYLGSSTCVRYFPGVGRFELTSVRHGVSRRLGYCDG